MISREVRRVPLDWKHPRMVNGHFKPLLCGSSFKQDVDEWELGFRHWETGLYQGRDGILYKIDDTVYGIGEGLTYIEWAGPKPVWESYMPVWDNTTLLGYSMYETVSQGTPISPSFKTLEELVEYLVETSASIFQSSSGSYADWEIIIQRYHNLNNANKE